MAEERFQAKYRTMEEIRHHGAIGNLQDGITIDTHGVTARLVAWPGTGYQTESVHVLTLHPGEESRPGAGQWLEAPYEITELGVIVRVREKYPRRTTRQTCRRAPLRRVFAHGAGSLI